MKSRKLILVTAMTLFTALAIPVRLAAQEQNQQERAKPHRYTFVEVVTLGGPNFSSNFTGAPNTLLNNRGTLAGGADTIETDPFCLNNPDCFVMHAFRWRDGVVTDLGTLPGGANSQAFWVNGRGLIAGMSQNGVIDPLLGIQALKAVVWDDGDIVNLGTLEGGYESLAQSINDRGQVTGIALNTVPDPFACCAFFPNTQNRAFLWKDGEMQDLGTLGGPDAQGKFINDRGQIAGISYVSFEPTSSGEPQIDPFLWEDGVMMDLGSLGGTFGEPEGLNNRGQVVGDMNLAGDVTGHPFLWQRGSLLDLGTLGGTFGLARAVNDSGEIVGSATNQNDQAMLAFVWQKGVMTDLGTLKGYDCSIGQNINSRGQIVGASFSCAGGAFNATLWDNGSVIDLNSFVPPTANLHLIGDDIYINDRGEIAGTGALPNGDIRAFVLIPCEGKHADDEGCRDEGESIVAETQRTSGPITRSADATQGRLKPETLAVLRTQLARRYRGFAAWPKE
jgi:probable HAF family extracellular repeat protein